MSNPFAKRTESDNMEFASEEIEKDGTYVFQVVRSYDSYKVNPEDVDDPERGRYINLRVEARDVRPTISFEEGEKLTEPEDEVEDRKSEVGKYADVRVNLKRDGHVKVLTGNLQLLATIAGSTGTPDQKILDKAYQGTEDGEDRYDMGLVADEAHINATTLLGRMFIGRLTSFEYNDKMFHQLHPWTAHEIPDDEQPTFLGKPRPASNLYEGEDTESERTKKKFEEVRGNKDNSGNGSAKASTKKNVFATAEASGNDDDFVDDDLPF